MVYCVRVSLLYIIYEVRLDTYLQCLIFVQKCNVMAWDVQCDFAQYWQSAALPSHANVLKMLPTDTHMLWHTHTHTTAPVMMHLYKTVIPIRLPIPALLARVHFDDTFYVRLSLHIAVSGTIRRARARKSECDRSSAKLNHCCFQSILLI